MTAAALFRSFASFGRSRWFGALLILAVLVAAGVAGYASSERYGMHLLREEGRHRLDLLAAAVDAEVSRVTHIPGILALNADVLELLRTRHSAGSPQQEVVNRYLERLSAQHVDSLAVFVMDTRGRVVASSDWILTDNLLGADFSHRSYFQAAIGGAPYRQYAVDGVRDEPGYFFAQPIRDERQDWKIVGVAVLKASIRAVERQWLTNDAPALIADDNGVVLLSAPPEWRYATLRPLSGEQVSELVRRQFEGRQLGTMSLGIDAAAAEAGIVVNFSGRPAESLGPPSRGSDYLVMSRNLPGTAWHLLVLSSVRPVRSQALAHGALAAAASATLILCLLYLRQRRRVLQARLKVQAALEAANRELEGKVAARTADLTRTVETLEAEVVERLRAEQTLRAAQEELVQAGKLAVLGQLATGITHELNQPLGAVRTLAANAIEFMHRGDAGTAERNLRIVCDLTDQMGGIIRPLKTFARKSPAVPSRVDVAQAVGSALFLLDQSLRQAGVVVDNRCVAGEHFSWCDHNRLQQVLINLIGNAADAMNDRSERRLEIAAAERPDGGIALAVADTGCGLPEAVLDRLFEPFFTTKAAGEGLGLGLAISRDIVRSFGGDLIAENREGGGARFVIVLPAAAEQGEEETVRS
ncbi:sensor histidine kinase [Azospira restricta]|uniref:C4-dicarboxylate transport sensor protein DctB n=1 Tax=Azospira restricta TaxID=404405 RepID=A0A974Y312_9RHOO|nr:ATP-binding protein [Azospira restricta]QRJ63634.1 sensor histidine kinase [Azospira restricta]